MESPSRNPRLDLLRQAAVLQLKLLVDGFRDAMLIPISLVAAAIGVLRGGPDCDREYRRVIELGLRSERWINLFGHHQPLDESGKAGSLDTVLEQVESTVLEQYQRGRKSGGTASETGSEDRDADQPESSRKPGAG
jgi:hypothetical protein